MVLIAKIILTLPLNTACCERAFSYMKRVKNDWRSSLLPSTLCDLMLITIEGPALDQYDPEEAVNIFFASSEQPRRPNLLD